MDSADAQKHQSPMDSLDWQAYRNLSLQPHGFGEERVRIWPKLVNVDDQALLSEHPDPMESSIWSDVGFDLGDSEKEELDGDPHADEHQIGLDTDRSFVLYPVEGVSSREKLQTALNRLIISLFRRRPQLHYFQGYHDIVSVVFLTLPKELHLPVVEKLSLHRVRDSMGTTLDPVVGLLRVLKRLLELVDPQFAEALERTAPLPYYALSYLLTLFSHDVPTLPLIQHIFDYLLCRPPIAVVYLAAALTLTRRQEVQALEEEGEDGMVHSLLTVLPDLYEEGDDPPEPLMEEKLSLPQDPPAELLPKTEMFEHVEPAETNIPATALPTHEGLELADLDGSTDVSTEPSEIEVSRERESSVDASTDGGSETLVDADELAQTTYGTNTPATPSSPEPKAVVEPSSETPHPSPEDEPEKLPLLAPDESDEHAPLPSKDEKPTQAPARTPSPSPPRRDPRPRRPRLSLTALLTQADALMREYPPTHPDVALRTVMGPQSVVHTWAECADDLPPDDDAERMVDRPELVVLPPPPSPSPSPVPSEDEDEDADFDREKDKRRERERGRKRLRKPRRLGDVIGQRRAMVAGAVLVLGVAVAVYGLSGGLQAHGHGHGGQRAAWWKVGKMLGGMVGVGERVFDGIRDAL